MQKGADSKMHKFLFDILEEYYFLDDYMCMVKMALRKTILMA
jgi:hypothetical protein